MAQLGMTFDATQVDPNQFPLVPPGTYLAHIVASDKRPTNKGDGTFIHFELEILEGPHQGSKLFDNLNLENPNPKTVKIAQSTLSAICHATGVMAVSDTEQLHARRMMVEVQIVPPKDGYRASNKITAYKRPDAQVATQQAAPMSQYVAQQAVPTQNSPAVQNGPRKAAPWSQTPPANGQQSAS